MERKFKFSIDEFYHLYNRGIEKRTIFLDLKDKERFINLLFLCNGSKPLVFKDIPQGLPLGKVNKGEPLVAIGAYCLMPNHFHILVSEIIENGISKFIWKLLTAYSMYFNKKYKRTGRLFEGTFRAEYVDSSKEFEDYVADWLNYKDNFPQGLPLGK